MRQSSKTASGHKSGYPVSKPVGTGGRLMEIHIYTERSDRRLLWITLAVVAVVFGLEYRFAVPLVVLSRRSPPVLDRQVSFLAIGE